MELQIDYNYHPTFGYYAACSIDGTERFQTRGSSKEDAREKLIEWLKKENKI